MSWSMRDVRWGGVLLFAAALLGLASCRRTPEGVILQREWTANAEFAGDVWAQELSSKEGPRISVREGSDSLDPIKEVRSGAAQFGVASADRVLRENEGGAGLVVLAAATYKTPVVFLSWPETQIKSPADFRGRKVGIQTGTNTEIVFKSLIQAAGLDLQDIKVVESGWGTTNFETKALEILAAFDYDEPVQLERKGIKAATLYPERFGVNHVGTVYFTSRAYMEAHPDTVQSFVNHLVDGWRLAIARQGEAIRKVKSQFPDIDLEKERESLRRGVPYFAGENGQLLYAKPERWESMAKSLIKLGLLRGFEFHKNVDYRFLETAVRRASVK